MTNKENTSMFYRRWDLLTWQIINGLIVMVLIVLCCLQSAKADTLDQHLMRAVEFRDSPEVVFFIKKGADPNIRNENGDTALFKACTYGDSDIIKFLIDQGADVNRKTTGGYTPLMAGVYSQILKTYRKVDTVLTY